MVEEEPELLGAASPSEVVENSSKFIKENQSPYIPSRSPSLELRSADITHFEGPTMATTPTPNMRVLEHYGAMTPTPVYDTPITPGAGASFEPFEDIYEGVLEVEGSGKRDEEGLQPQALYDIEAIDVSKLVYHYFNDSDQSDDDDMAMGHHVRDHEEEEKRASLHSVHSVQFQCPSTPSGAMKGEIYAFPSTEHLDHIEGASASALDLEAIQDREFIEELKRNGIDHPEEIMQPLWDQQIENERGPQIMGILKQFCETVWCSLNLYDILFIFCGLD